MQNFDKYLKSLKPEERLSIAKEKTSKLVDHVSHVIALNKSNAFLCSSDLISKQVDRSYAANTFNRLRDSQYAWELTRLCALWDKPGKNRESIPTIIALIDNPDVQNLCSIATAGHWEKEMGEKYLHRIKATISIATCVQLGIQIEALRKIRDQQFAHNLDGRTSTEVDPAHSFKYGNERSLLKAAERVTKRLHSGVNNSDIDYKSWHENAEKSSRMFWSGVSVKVLG